MSEFESEYEYECMRADLLGLPKPDKDSLPVRTQPEEAESTMAEDDSARVAVEEATDVQEEQLQGARGGLDEMHNILSITQKKLNNLKCGIGNVGSSFSSSLSGSLTGLTGFIKQRVGGAEPTTAADIPETVEDPSGGPMTTNDKLDSMLRSADAADMKLAAQNKTMRQMLNK